jgi:hypothetical protein
MNTKRNQKMKKNMNLSIFLTICALGLIAQNAHSQQAVVGLTEVEVNEDHLIKEGRVENEENGSIIVAECITYNSGEECKQARIVYQPTQGRKQAFVLSGIVQYGDLLPYAKDAKSLFDVKFRPFPVTRKAHLHNQESENESGSAEVIVVQVAALVGGAIVDAITFFPRLPFGIAAVGKKNKQMDWFETDLFRLVTGRVGKEQSGAEYKVSTKRFDLFFEKIVAMGKVIPQVKAPAPAPVKK